MPRRAVALSVLAVLGSAAPAHAALQGTPEVVVDSLATPWEVAPLPDGRLYVTERPGRIRVVATNGTLCATSAFAGTSTETFRKFLGLALHPGWAQNRFVYLYESISTGSRILRLRSSSDGMTLAFDRVIFDGIPTEGRVGGHDGGRIAFGPDGKLYVTTGDVHDPDLPRDVTKLSGKILRLEAPGDDTDGQPAAGNPFLGHADENARRVYSLGHRHPQGLAWDDADRLWETEHGPSNEAHAPDGAKSGRDELNLIVAGGDYGWPTVAGDQTAPGTIPPKVHSGPPPAWAPGDLAFASDGHLYAPMLNGEHLRRFDIVGEDVDPQEVVYNTYGRLRVGVADGDTFWFTQDGGTADLLRVGIDGPLPAFGSGDCGALGTDPEGTPMTQQPTTSGTPSGGPPTTGGQQTPATGLPLALPGPAPASAVPLDRLLGRAGSSLRRRGALARLLRTGRLAVTAGGLAPGRVVMRVKARRGGRSVTVAQGSARPRSRSAFTLRLRLTPGGRSVLRRARAARLLLETTYQPAAGARVVRTLSLTARR